jgi:Uma2 family endonuclease
MSTDAATVPPVAPNLALEPECEPSYEGLITEDHKPVERILIEKLYRLLTHPLYASWAGPSPERTFLVLANVGWFYKEKTSAVAPDVLLSLDASCPEDLHVKQGHSYYQWQAGKPPDVVIDFVSDRTGGEDSFKRNLYARQGLPYYAIYDPEHHLSEDTLRTFELSGGAYRPVSPGPWPTVGLGLRLWTGVFEGHRDTWLRWCDADGEIIPTAEETAALLAERASQAEVRASEAEERAFHAEDLVGQAEERAFEAEDRARRAEERAVQGDERIRLLEEELRRLRGERPPSAP